MIDSRSQECSIQNSQLYLEWISNLLRSILMLDTLWPSRWNLSIKLIWAKTKLLEKCIPAVSLTKTSIISTRLVNNDENLKLKENQVAPVDKFRSSENVMNLKEAKENEEKQLKRVSIKGIEFDWIFDTHDGASF